MNLTWIDLSIIFGMIIFLIYMALQAAQHNKGVTDFLAANRCAGRYLLGAAEGVAAVGTVSVIVGFEMWYATGPVQIFWGALSVPLGLFIALSGWVVYRYRRTRALTLAQFFEMRYSKKFRVFAGMICWISGIINFGVFPAIATRFFINFCNLPDHILISGVSLPTQPLLMAFLVAISLYFTFAGGQISIIVTDFWQSIFTMSVFLAVAVILWFQFPWHKISESFVIASKPGYSMIDPFDIKDADFSLVFFIIGWFFTLYQYMAWQGSQAYNASASNAHEAKMAKVVGSFRSMAVYISILLIPFAAITVMNHPDYVNLAANVTSHLKQSYPADQVLQRQMLTTVVLSKVLPMGFIGAFAAAMLAFTIGSQSAYMHSWGSILIQDVILPLRKKQPEPKRHVLLLRMSAVFVALFIYIFSIVFPMKDYVYMFFQITGAIYLGGAGTVIIGGLYWKRGTTAAAWTAMITGSSLAVVSIILQAIWTKVPFLVSLSPQMPANGQTLAFIAAICSICSYIAVSLIGKPVIADLDKLLHRGQYIVQDEQQEIESHSEHKVNRFWKFLGADGHEFSGYDKLMFLYAFSFGFIQFASVLIVILLRFFGFMGQDRWLTFWKISITFFAINSAICAIWVITGGFFDLFKMFSRLNAIKRDDLDDGRVVEKYVFENTTLTPQVKSEDKKTGVKV